MTALRMSIIQKGETRTFAGNPSIECPPEGGAEAADMAVSDEQFEPAPGQPDEVVRAVEALLVDPAADVDPWWRAGLDEALGESDI